MPTPVGTGPGVGKFPRLEYPASNGNERSSQKNNIQQIALEKHVLKNVLELDIDSESNSTDSKIDSKLQN